MRYYEEMGHMIYVDGEIKKGLGYEQMALYAPIKQIDPRFQGRVFVRAWC